MPQKTTSDDRTPLPDRPTASSTSTLSSYGLSGALPPPPPARKHYKWEASYVHSAQCDGCHTKKHKVMQRCLSCTLQYCKTCMPKARLNAHEYDEGELDWDPSSATPQHRDHGSLRKMLMKGEKLPTKSRFGGGGFGLGDDEEDELEEELVVLGSSAVSGKGREGNKGDRGMGYENERLMSENEKYQGPRQGQGNGTVAPTIFGGPPTQNMLIKDEDDGFTTPLSNKRRRKTGGASGFASAAENSDSIFDDVEFTGQRFNDGPKQASYASSNTPFRPNIRQQPDNNRPQRQPASTTSSRLNQAQSQAFYDYRSQQEAQAQAQAQAQLHKQTSKSTIRRAAAMLNKHSTFEDATDAVMKAREDEEMLPARRKRFEEYCREAWSHEPVLRQLREEGRGEEAEDLYFASREALSFARGLGGDDA
ncbi:hypothetical protein DL95DRAFT_487211 [Leptodontidium sp. 2 PMI_412]|nr:hypothetical protein DL95DRAFT_487211 [Leptodontidium sp. 2 PMI_412]